MKAKLVTSTRFLTGFSLIFVLVAALWSAGCGAIGVDGIATVTPTPTPDPEPTPEAGQTKLGITIDSTFISIDDIASVFIVDTTTGAVSDLTNTIEDTAAGGKYFEIDLSATTDKNGIKVICLQNVNTETIGIFGNSILNAALSIGPTPVEGTLTIATTANTTTYSDLGITHFYPTDTTDSNTTLDTSEELLSDRENDERNIRYCNYTSDPSAGATRYDLTTFTEYTGCNHADLGAACAFANYAYTNTGYYLDVSPNATGCAAELSLAAPGILTNGDNPDITYPAGTEMEVNTAVDCNDRGNAQLYSNFGGVKVAGPLPEGEYTIVADGVTTTIRDFVPTAFNTTRDAYIPILLLEDDGVNYTGYMIQGWYYNDGSTTTTITSATRMATILSSVTLQFLGDINQNNELTTFVHSEFQTLATAAAIADVDTVYIGTLDSSGFSWQFAFGE